MTDRVSSTEHLEIEAQLDLVGAKRSEHLRLRAEAAELARDWIPKAIAAGIPVAEIARRAHMTRASVYAFDHRSHTEDRR